jgi:hypothetical protein
MNYGTAAMIAGSVTLGLALAQRARRATPNYRAQGMDELVALAQQVDPYIPGFSLFAPAAAYGESRGKSDAANRTTSEAKAACTGYERNKNGRFASNPYPASDWCWGSGGWFGFLPSTALSAPGFHNRSPYLVFEPKASIAMFADYIRRIVAGFWGRVPAQHQNWLTVRRFMASNVVGLDWNEQRILSSDTDGVPRATKVRRRLASHLKAVGLPESVMFQQVRIHNWPGAVTLWQQLD